MRQLMLSLVCIFSFNLLATPSKALTCLPLNEFSGDFKEWSQITTIFTHKGSYHGTEIAIFYPVGSLRSDRLIAIFVDNNTIKKDDVTFICKGGNFPTIKLEPLTMEQQHEFEQIYGNMSK